MSRFTLGVIVGILAALTPILWPLMAVLGVYVLLTSGLAAPGEGASAGVLWVAAWTAIFTLLLAALAGVALGLWLATRVTLLVAGTLLVLAVIVTHMTRPRGESRGTP